MFGHHDSEALDLLRSIHHDLHTFHTFHRQTMASLQQVQDAQTTTAQAVADLATRIANQAPPAATASDLDTLVQGEQAIQAKLAAIDPTPVQAAV